MTEYVISSKYDIGRYQMPERKPLEEQAFPQIRAFLNKHHVPSSAYVLGAESYVSAGGLCLYFEEGIWVVCSMDRGEIINPAFFASLWDAAKYFTWQLVSAHDQTFPCFRLPISL